MILFQWKIKGIRYVILHLFIIDVYKRQVQAFIKQMFVFYSGRVITLVVEEAIVLVFITWLGFNSMLIKVIAQVIVIVLNYVCLLYTSRFV